MYAPTTIRVACNKDEAYNKMKEEKVAEEAQRKEDAQVAEEAQTETGSNICVTNQWAIIRKPKKLQKPITIGGIDNGSTIPEAAATIISPNAEAKDHADKIVHQIRQKWEASSSS